MSFHIQSILGAGIIFKSTIPCNAADRTSACSGPHPLAAEELQVDPVLLWTWHVAPR